jgi:hypothetical protein
LPNRKRAKWVSTKIFKTKIFLCPKL